jgi:hypothetical protein
MAKTKTKQSKKNNKTKNNKTKRMRGLVCRKACETELKKEVEKKFNSSYTGKFLSFLGQTNQFNDKVNLLIRDKKNKMVESYLQNCKKQCEKTMFPRV